MFQPLFLWSDRIRQRAEARRLAAVQSAGRRGEDLAHRFLESRGFRVVARNWMPPGRHCEIDLVAEDGEQVVFVEVKSRSTSEYGDPERNVDRIKRGALRAGAAAYARINRVDPERVRFDLVTVVLTDPPEIRHTPAFLSSRGSNR